ncbi:sigma-70 family RNA polymerase sigma factor [Hyunsoonleella sp. SJ7]|uniref:Sigma-70 family RNA polymerase sigma factor n=1 Tax=Hyunsoonleella aquatilis TaxID=2762758 RepID=A0A923H6P5_9FLAO|nr:sigma-70 family RNA polymerase sigma factor [Hyunsoonleella aquatilis]MBC3757306.1 sigma-70 family RNA polymerase sigma factor [Hyunsoonleella aquatilis]
MRQATKLEHQLHLIEAIKNNNSKALKSFYIENYPKVESLVLKNSGSVDHAKDIYQEAFITVWNHVKIDRFKPENETALQGYLYRIAKNKWTDVVRSKSFKGSRSLTDEALNTFKDEDFNEGKPKDDEKLKLAMEAFKNLGQPCKQLLRTFYFEKKSLRDISIELNIEETTARNKKYRCMKKLKSMIVGSK